MYDDTKTSEGRPLTKADLVDAERSCGDEGVRPRVTRQHDEANAVALQCADRFPRFLLDRVRDGKETREPAIDRDEDEGRAWRGERHTTGSPR